MADEMYLTYIKGLNIIVEWIVAFMIVGLKKVVKASPEVTIYSFLLVREVGEYVTKKYCLDNLLTCAS